ncbi:MAG TPA: peptide-methionine (R)-S-oxide reductase MsrB [Pyrinomonadaceae bacterium]|nr:peptide-methionine (R)-S-oxide reductase MsrB [Pyrinomonadaceae bacterium]
MNRRFFISSSVAVGALAALSRLPLLAQIVRDTQAGEAKLNDLVASVRYQPSPVPGGNGASTGALDNKSKAKGIKKVVKTDAEWKAQLTPEQYEVLRREGTEYAFSSPLNDIHDKGTFVCAGCELPVFSSDQKFDSGTGWPSFWAPIKKENVIEEVDRSFGMTRTKVSCAQCDGHLGHVFDDGPKPTGLRYCMNGVAMKFVKKT